MDTFLFQDTVPLFQTPDHGPLNERRFVAIFLSTWYGGNHADYPACHFEDYLSLRGWDWAKLEIGDFRNAHPESKDKPDEKCVLDAIGVIQAWLTLGFLEDLFQGRNQALGYLTPIDEVSAGVMRQALHAVDYETRQLMESFCDPNDLSTCILDGKNLVGHLTLLRWRLLYETDSDESFLLHKQRLPQLNQNYFNAIEKIERLNKYDEERDVTVRPIIPDVEVGFYLHCAVIFPSLVFEAVQLHIRKYSPDQTLTRPRFMDGMMRRTLLSQQRWCPYTIEKLWENTSNSVVYWVYASAFESKSKLSHDRCSKGECVAAEVNEESQYPETHVDGCARPCQRKYFSTTALEAYLRQDHIPVVVARLIEGREGAFEYDIDNIRPEAIDVRKPFVAFSHVWADGFGSSTEEGIPECQARFLTKACFDILGHDSKEVRFWIDSVCIPAADIARKKAIQLMSTTYKVATQVIVLDHTLQQCTSKASPEELLLRIYTSPWMNRLWTYQEGALASQLRFKMKDGYVLLDFPIDSSVGDQFTQDQLRIPGQAATTHNIYQYLRNQVQHLNGQISKINIAHVARELRWRKTLHRDPNRRNDELLAVAVLLDFDVKCLLSAEKGDASMAVFLQMADVVPKNIIFAETQHLKLPGFRWAPNTFLTRDTRPLEQDIEGKNVRCIPSGLTGRYMTFKVPPGQEPLEFGDQQGLTIEDTTLDPPRWFDILFIGVGLETPFLFDHIILLEEEVPPSTRDTFFMAAMALRTEYYKVEQRHDANIDAVLTFQSLAVAGVARERDDPVRLEHLSKGHQRLRGTFQNMEILLR